jgi:hypothetical protein
MRPLPTLLLPAARARPAIERSLAILRAQDGDVRAALGDALHLSGYLQDSRRAHRLEWERDRLPAGEAHDEEDNGGIPALPSLCQVHGRHPENG